MILDGVNTFWTLDGFSSIIGSPTDGSLILCDFCPCAPISRQAVANCNFCENNLGPAVFLVRLSGLANSPCGGSSVWNSLWAVPYVGSGVGSSCEYHYALSADERSALQGFNGFFCVTDAVTDASVHVTLDYSTFPTFRVLTVTFFWRFGPFGSTTDRIIFRVAGLPPELPVNCLEYNDMVIPLFSGSNSYDEAGVLCELTAA